MKRHHSLRPYVHSADELYALLQRLQGDAYASLGYRAIAMVSLLAVGIVAPGTIGSTALCLAALVAITCVAVSVDIAARSWVMHLLTLRDLLQPPRDFWAEAGRQAAACTDGGRSKIEGTN